MKIRQAYKINKRCWEEQFNPRNKNDKKIYTEKQVHRSLVVCGRRVGTPYPSFPEYCLDYKRIIEKVMAEIEAHHRLNHTIAIPPITTSPASQLV